MKNNFSRLLTAALGVFCLTARLCADITVDSVITSGLFEPFAVAVDVDGTFYLTDAVNHRIVKVPTGLTSLTPLAGQLGVSGSANGLAEAAQFNLPQGIVIARGGLVVADSANQLIRFVSFNGAVSNLAGTAGSNGLINAQGSAARFRFPLGLAADSAGNIYIADSQNNAIRKLDLNNNVTTVAGNFFQPNAVAVGDNGDLWVTDTRRHCIKRIDTNGVVTLVAGVPTISGTTDSTFATNALFSNPRGLLWVGGASGLLISDSGNHTIRRLYYNTNFNSYSITTFAGTPAQAGAVNGTALSAKFNTPMGLASDPVGGGFLVVDKGNNQVRRINTGAVQPPVADPTIGWVDFVSAGSFFVTQLRPVQSAVFNNDVIIAIRAEQGTQTYFTYGATPANPFEDTIPSPGSGVGNTPPVYRDGTLASAAPNTMVQPQPDLTIKAIGTQLGRRSSSVVQSRFQFQVGNPSISGENAASFKIGNVTANAEMWYTWDGADPTNNAASGSIGPIFADEVLSFNLNETNHTFKIRGFRTGYRPSDLITKVFSPSNFVANTITFGFAGGEASSEFVAAAGQRFYAPVTLTTLPGQTIYSFQFNVVATNLTGPSIDSTVVGFRSMLEEPIADGAYRIIPPAMSLDGSSTLTSLLITNPSVNLLGVGWVERLLFTNLYNTLQHDLIKYSQAHDTLFDSANGKVVLGGYSFRVPVTAPAGSTYQITLGRASATADGISKDVFIKIPTNGAPADGAINGIKTVTVGSRAYVVGDSTPFRWFNAGDFGDNNLLNNDVVQTFQSAIYRVNMPPAESDFFDVMDSSNGTVSDLFDGNIDSITMGDGSLNVDDVYVTYRRSLDPTLKWYARFWENGILKAIEVPNGASAMGPSAAPAKKSPLVRTGIPTVGVSADDIVAAAGSTVQVPIRVHITGGLPIRIAMLNVTVEPLDGAPALTSAIDITAAAGLGAPTFRTSQGANDVSATWLNNAASGVAGDGVLATLTVQIPAAAGPSAAYRVHFNHFSCSENGLALFRKYARDGVVTLTSRTGSSWGDGISDLWRLRFFGAVSNALSTASADPDHDGATNLAEYRGGTDPLDGACALRLKTVPLAGGVKLTFPTGLGRTYVIECASELFGPWSPLSTNVGDGIPREFLDAAGSKRFYRVRAQ